MRDKERLIGYLKDYVDEYGYTGAAEAILRNQAIYTSQDFHALLALAHNARDYV